MPVSGHPTKPALLKIPHGSSCAEANAFQNTLNAVGAASVSRPVPACAALRFATSISTAAEDTASSTASETVAMTQLRCNGRGLPAGQPVFGCAAAWGLGAG